MKLGILLWVVTFILIIAGLYFISIGTVLPGSSNIEFWGVTLKASAAGLFVLILSIIPLIFAIKENVKNGEDSEVFQLFVYEKDTNRGLEGVTIQLTGSLVTAVKTGKEGNVPIEYTKKYKNTVVYYHAKRTSYNPSDGSFKINGESVKIFLEKRSEEIIDTHNFFHFYVDVHEEGDLTKKISNAEVRVAMLNNPNLLRNQSLTDYNGTVTFSLPPEYEGKKILINAEKQGYHERPQLEIELVKDKSYSLALKKKLSKGLSSPDKPVNPPKDEAVFGETERLKEEIRNLIAQNRMQQAIDLLLKLPMTNEYANDAKIYAQEWSLLDRENRLGLINREEFRRKTLRLTDNVLNHISKI